MFTGVLNEVHLCLKFNNCSEQVPTQPSVATLPATIEPAMAVLVIACNRENYIKRTLDSLLRYIIISKRGHVFYIMHTVLLYRYRPSAGLFPIIVSQDCDHLPTNNAISSYGNSITHIKVSSKLYETVAMTVMCFHSNQINLILY